MLHSLFAELCDELDIVHFGLNFYDEPPRDLGWTIEPNRVLGDPYGVTQLPGLLDRHRPDVVLLCYDAWLFEHLEPVLAAYAKHAPLRSMFYCPVESTPRTPRSFEALARADLIVAYTEFGRRALVDTLSGSGAALPPVIAIPHGVDGTRFFPLDRGRARAELFPDRPELADAFIVLNANRNVPRKRVDLTMDAFAAFAATRPDAYLYMHMGMRDRGIWVVERAERLGIADRLLTTSREPEMPHITDARLNLVYNACDVGVNTSVGEGWGLVSFEHAATGALQIVPDHTACAELWADRAILVPVHDGADPRLENVVIHDAMVGALEQAYLRPEALARRGHELATHADLSWARVADRWRELLGVRRPNGSRTDVRPSATRDR